jgi:hypothetical protein
VKTYKATFGADADAPHDFYFQAANPCDAVDRLRGLCVIDDELDQLVEVDALAVPVTRKVFPAYPVATAQRVAS